MLPSKTQGLKGSGSAQSLTAPNPPVWPPHRLCPMQQISSRSLKQPQVHAQHANLDLMSPRCFFFSSLSLFTETFVVFAASYLLPLNGLCLIFFPSSNLEDPPYPASLTSVFPGTRALCEVFFFSHQHVFCLLGL